MTNSMPNAARAYRALDAGRAHDALDMDAWVKFSEGERLLIGLPELTSGRTCGTTACLAGWVAAQAGYQVGPRGWLFQDGRRTDEHVVDVAGRLLELTEDQRIDLFYADNHHIDEVMEELLGPRPEELPGQVSG
jgi:hypothetical protein